LEDNVAAGEMSIPEARLMVYPVGSADKMYIEVNQRELMVRHDPTLGPVLRGEVPGCGAECAADLGQVILEYVVACDRCEDESVFDEFGAQIGVALAAHVRRSLPDDSVLKQATRALLCVLNSQRASYSTQQAPIGLRFALYDCPLCVAAANSGIGGREDQAHRVLYALYRALIQTLDPGLHIDLPARPHMAGEALVVMLKDA
jgi:hypothetical protein